MPRGAVSGAEFPATIIPQFCHLCKCFFLVTKSIGILYKFARSCFGFAAFEEKSPLPKSGPPGRGGEKQGGNPARAIGCAPRFFPFPLCPPVCRNPLSFPPPPGGGAGAKCRGAPAAGCTAKSPRKTLSRFPGAARAGQARKKRYFTVKASVYQAFSAGVNSVIFWVAYCRICSASEADTSPFLSTSA